jgi:alkaline phosphatase D
MILLLLALAQQPSIELGPMVGYVGPDEVRIWVKATGNAELSLRWGEREDLSDARSRVGPALGVASEFMGHARIGGLQPATRYHYQVVLNGKPHEPKGTFVTAPPPGTQGRLRFAFGSCVGKVGKDAGPAWADMAGRSFDLLLMLGDNHYADSTEPAKQRAAYYSHRAVPDYAAITRRTPTLGIWDDRDFGPNNSDRTAVGKELSLDTFTEFWANPGYGEERNPGVYFRFSWGAVDFFMLDSRYHRTPNTTEEDGRKTMLGERQVAWLKSGLVASTATFKVVACGSEWQTHTQPDCWKSFLRERDDIFRAIGEIPGLIFLSGDRHFTGGYQINGRFLEITSGPLGSKNYPTKNLPEMFLNYGEGKLYTILRVRMTASGLTGA